jgi:hypothetical protein
MGMSVVNSQTSEGPFGWRGCEAHLKAAAYSAAMACFGCTAAE